MAPETPPHTGSHGHHNWPPHETAHRASRKRNTRAPATISCNAALRPLQGHPASHTSKAVLRTAREAMPLRRAAPQAVRLTWIQGLLAERPQGLVMLTDEGELPVPGVRKLERPAASQQLSAPSPQPAVEQAPPQQAS
mmetsp:Transcript_58254/g.155670  ORF Transcript_58254/g.155670 Transcript_58254/m.155670 type:complete len:138 (+) Transcript_58254:208-621(+)